MTDPTPLIAPPLIAGNSIARDRIAGFRIAGFRIEGALPMNRRHAVASLAALAAAALSPHRSAFAADVNPLSQAWTGPYGGVPPWDQVTPPRIKAALEDGIGALRSDITALTSNPAPATFDNTIKALETAGRTLDRASRLFDVMVSNMSTPDYRAVQAEMSPKLAAAYDDIIALNQPLFRRVETVWRERTAAPLNAEQRRVVELTYDQFVRGGAKLGPRRKARVSAINQELAALFTTFQNKVLADENSWVVIDTESDLAGLPGDVAAAMRAAAEERKLAGQWVVVNTRSAVEPFLTFADSRPLREKVWRAFVKRGDNKDANDTNQTIAQIVKLRAERARILGYRSHAHWRMSDTMAKDPERALDLMKRVWRPATVRVAEEVAEMQALVDAANGGFSIEPWDYRYYAEKVRKAKYDLDESEIKPYFEVNTIKKAAFWTAEQLFGLTFTEVQGVPVWHPDVRVFEVKDKPSGRHVGLFYSDDFARIGKRSGAWMTSYRDQNRIAGDITPLVSNNNNFIKGAPGEAILISLDDAETLFHEFGHALHGLLSNVTYPSISGTATPRDFVEYPSQVMEHWVLTRDVLDRFARHYQTNAPMPAATLEKIQKTLTFNQGFKTVEYLSAAIIDMELHLKPDGVVDADAFEREALSRLGMPKEIVMRHRLPQFLHLFSSDAYSAGYYSYLWSEVMDADTWEAFATAGPFNTDIARRWKDKIFSVGNSVDLRAAYREFRGRDPDVAALLAVRGFPTGRP
jgi:peptidyl-dipeptidase Dcp